MEYFPGFTRLRNYDLESYSPKCVKAAYQYFSNLIYFSSQNCTAGDPTNNLILNEIFENCLKYNEKLANHVMQAIKTAFNKQILLEKFIKSWIDNFDTIHSG